MPWRGPVLAACVSGSVALHLGVLLAADAPAAASASPSTRVDRSARTEARPMQVSLAEHRAAPASRTGPPAPGTRPAPPAAAASAPAPMLADVAETLALDALEPTGAGPGAADQEEGDQAYLPRSLLTRAPVPQHAIDLLYPELAPSGLFRAVLTLFIDDQGVVRRVRIDEAGDSGLPPVLEDAARQTFLRSSFTPGEIDGRPIRSRLRIEVEYASTPPQDSGRGTSR